MAIEKFANNAATTLSAAITSVSATSLTVTSAASFPATGNFRIKIDSEILIVTNVSGTTFTVTRGAEGTTAATHANGADVIHLLTKGGLEARVANRFLSDTHANRPAAGVKGRLFLPTDGLFLEYDDGSAWHKYGPFRRLKAPPQTGWSWINQGNATATFSGGALVLEDPDLDGVSPQLRLYVRSLMAGVTSVVAAFAYHGVASMNGPKAGVCARTVGGSDDGNFTTWGVRMWQTSSYPFLEAIHYASPTATEGTPSYDNRVLWPVLRVYWVKFSWEGNYKRWYWSTDGVNWLKWAEDTYSQYNAPSQVGIFIDPLSNNNKVSLSLLHWEES
jgi:hypothetical protein